MARFTRSIALCVAFLLLILPLSTPAQALGDSVTRITLQTKSPTRIPLQMIPQQTLPAETEPTEAAAEPTEAVTEPTEAATEPTEPQETEPVEEPVEEEEELKYPLYFQTDYPKVRYGNGTIASSGCGITSLAMVATYMTGHEYLPDELADYFGGYDASNTDRMLNAASKLQLPWRFAENWHESKAALEAGCPVIVLENENSPFTETQHYIVLWEINEDGRIVVYDSYEPNYSKWDLKYGFENGFTEDQICSGYSGSWIFDISLMPEEPFIYMEAPRPYVEPRYPGVELTFEEEELLARMVWVESRGETMEGQQAVAEVVLNRLVSGNYGSSIESIIRAENQFRSVEFLDDAEPTQTQYDAIEQALYGPYVLPIDVVFFATYAVNDRVWGEIGGHTFCYEFAEKQ